MKKIIFLFCCLFIFNIIVKADDTFYLGEKVPNMYVESIRGNEIHNGAPFLLHRNSDGSVVYCINPFVMMSTTGVYKSYTYNASIFNLTDERLNKMNIIAYYGYGYKNHTDIKWFGITQYLLWKNMGYDAVYFTDVYYGNRVEKYTNEVKELETMVNDYYKLPSFNNNHYFYDPNQKYEIIDTNNVLNNYEIKETNINTSISDNKLIINTKNSGTYKITFVRKSPITRNYILYNLSGAQSLFYPGKINDITFSISIEVNSGSITINKYDSENKQRLEASLSGAKYGLYKNNVLINELTINSSNTSSISNLPFGSYTLKEISTSKGYNKDTKVYDIVISKSNKDVVINLYSKVIEGNLIINKYYGSNNDYKLDENAVFEIYNNGKLIKTLSNKVNEKLEYGTYLIKQVNGRKYYDLIDEFNVSILEEKDYKYDFYTDKTDEIKAYEELLNRKEESLNQKEQELVNIQTKIDEEKIDLINLKDEIAKKAVQLDKEKEQLKEKEESLKNFENSLEKEKNNLDILKDEIKSYNDMLNKKIEELNCLESELEILNKNLLTKEENLIEMEVEINKKSESINKLKDEIYILSNQLKEKEENLNIKEKNINTQSIELNKLKTELDLLSEQLYNKELELQQKEQAMIKLEKEVLVVEVPNTHKISYNKLISKILIFIGGILVIFSNKIYKKKIF